MQRYGSQGCRFLGSKDLSVLRKILQHIESIMRYCADCRTLEDFSSDTMRLEATVFNLMQIGELAKESLSDEAKAQIKTLPWQQIYGMRNRIVHGYSGVNMQIVWDTVSVDIPMLHKELESIIKTNS